MKRALVLLLLTAVVLAGCTSKDKMSRDEMIERAEDALALLQEDLGPGGAIDGAALTVPVDAGGIRIGLKVTMEVGPVGDLLMSGSFGDPFSGNRLTFQAYCSPDRIVLVTDGLSDYDEDAEDISVEARNTAGSCTDPEAASGDVLGGFAGLTQVFTISDSDLRLEDIQQTGKKGIEATYRDPATASKIVVTVEDDRVEVIGATADEGDLLVDFTYGERDALTVPHAATTMGAPVVWDGEAFSDRYELTILDGESDLDDVALRVYRRGDTVPCTGGPAPAATFDLGDGDDQEHNGFTLRFFDAGQDGRLGPNDHAVLQHPDRFERDWTYQVEVWDTWADASADPLCSVPGPAPVVVGFGLLALAGIAVRRYW